MFLNDRNKLIKEAKKLEIEITDLVFSQKEHQAEADKLALKSELDPTIKKERDDFEEKAHAASIKIRQKKLALKQAKEIIAEIDAEKRERERSKKLDELIEQATSVRNAYDDVYKAATEFEQKCKIALTESQKLKDAAFAAGIGASVNSLLFRGTSTRTFEWILLAAAPQASRDIGLAQNLGRARGHCGLLTTLQKIDFNEWRTLKTDAERRKDKQSSQLSKNAMEVNRDAI